MPELRDRPQSPYDVKDEAARTVAPFRATAVVGLPALVARETPRAGEASGAGGPARVRLRRVGTGTTGR